MLSLDGGGGNDRIRGGRGMDLLIGGSAANQNDVAALEAALVAWTHHDQPAAPPASFSLPMDRPNQVAFRRFSR